MSVTFLACEYFEQTSKLITAVARMCHLRCLNGVTLHYSDKTTMLRIAYSLSFIDCRPPFSKGKLNN